MKLANNKWVLVVAFASIFMGCDVIEGPKKDYDNLVDASDKKVLLEEFTGHRCPNCPAAQLKAEDLLDNYGENLIVVSIHASSFANPVPSLGFPADYRTPEGSEIELFFDGAMTVGLPYGVINRTMHGSNTALQYLNWEAAVANELAVEPDLSLSLSTNYESGSRSLEVLIETEFFKEVENLQLVALITEDSIVSPQLDGTTTIQEYVHNHMLRDFITDVWGTSLKQGAINVGERINRTLNYQLPPEWNASHCDVVAYVMNADTREVLQAEKARLQ